MLRLHDTQSRMVKPLEASPDGRFRFYVCGPTIHDYAHIGNFRLFVWADVTRRVAYRGIPVTELPAGVGAGAEVVLFLSPSAVDAFAAAGGDLRAAPALAIGETTANVLRQHGVEPEVAPRADRKGLIDALENRVRSR